jgi:hypothetical protein
MKQLWCSGKVRKPILRYVVQILVETILIFFGFFNYLYLLDKTTQLQLKIKIQLNSKIFCLPKYFVFRGFELMPFCMDN